KQDASRLCPGEKRPALFRKPARRTARRRAGYLLRGDARLSPPHLLPRRQPPRGTSPARIFLFQTGGKGHEPRSQGESGRRGGAAVRPRGAGRVELVVAHVLLHDPPSSAATWPTGGRSWRGRHSLADRVRLLGHLDAHFQSSPPVSLSRRPIQERDALPA